MCPKVCTELRVILRLRTKTLLSEDKSKFVVTNDSPVSVREKIKPGSRVFSHQQTFHLGKSGIGRTDIDGRPSRVFQ